MNCSAQPYTFFISVKGSVGILSQINEKRDPDLNLHSYNHMIFEKDAKKICTREKTNSSTIKQGKLGICR